VRIRATREQGELFCGEVLVTALRSSTLRHSETARGFSGRTLRYGHSDEARQLGLGQTADRWMPHFYRCQRAAAIPMYDGGALMLFRLC
jgi:hypothetical protein